MLKILLVLFFIGVCLTIALILLRKAKNFIKKTTSIRVAEENDNLDNVKKYSKFGLEGTSWLSFRDVPLLIEKYVQGKTTLDYGCGAGRSTRFLRSLGLDPIGMDISSSMLEQARLLDSENRYVQIDSGKIPAPNNTYDLVFSSHVFLVLPTKEDIAKILTDLFRVLRDNGIFIVITGSEELHSRKMNWLSYNTDFPENTHLASGSLTKIQNKIVGTIFYDYNWLDNDYQKLFQENGFELLETHHPFGTYEDGYEWKSELEHSPFSIYVLRKRQCV